MKKFLIKTVVFSLMFACSQIVFGQGIELSLSDSKNCSNYTYCVNVGMKSSPGTGTVEIGNASLLLEYNHEALAFKNYTSYNFDGSGLCNGGSASAWAAHAYDEISLPGKFNLSLLLADNNYSCPSIDEGATISVGSVCFDILVQGASPEITFDSINCFINSDMPNDGSAQFAIASIDSLFAIGLMTCDCSGIGAPCDDQNVYTVDDKYDVNCKCVGTLSDVDMDGVYDGTDACFDTVYQAEDADWGYIDSLFYAGSIKNDKGQFTGTGFIDFWNGKYKFFDFDIYVDTAGVYDLNFRYALDTGVNFGIFYIDTVIVDSMLNFPVTGSWTNWDTVTISQNLSAGQHSVKYITDSWSVRGMNIDHLRVSDCTGCATSNQICDDGNACTVSDVYDSECNCGGIYMDSDNDGVCDASDICAGFDDTVDTDSDGVPDGCDDCDNALIGITCDDGDPCTTGDIYDSSCNCAGTFSGTDSDGDGVCDMYDICAGGDDNLDIDGDGIPDFCDPCDDLTIGLPCNDGDTCTILDRITPTCGCAGIFIDSDGDGVCNILDLCEGYDDNIDTDSDGIPDGCDNCDNALIGTPCDDNNSCTINDIYDSDCNCIGTFQDTDNDGTCDDYDLCQGFDDRIDSDLDVIPEQCDTCYDFTFQENAAVYVGAKFKTYHKGYSGDGYLDYQNQTGDTITYTVTVPVAGNYDVSIRYACKWSNRKLDVTIDGVLEISDFAFPVIGEWDRWDKVLFTHNFTPGTHTIQLTTNGHSGPNIDLVSLCLPGYQPDPIIAEGNNEFEQNFDNWTREHNWLTGTTQIEIDTVDENVVCGQKSARYGGAGNYEQLYADMRYLIIGDTMTLHFYSKGGEADVYVGSPDSVYTGIYLFKDASPLSGNFVHDSIEFVVTEPVMRIWFDLYPNDTLFIDAFSFDKTNCILRFEPTVFLEGNYDSNSGLMTDDLRASGLLPLTEPYSALNFQQAGRGGGETIDTTILSVTGNDAIVDWLLMELRDKTDSTQIAETKSVLLQRDGDVVDLDGVSPVTFRGVYADDFWVAARHRNHLGVMTSGSVAYSPSIQQIDFSVGISYGTTAQNTSGAVNLFWSGDTDNSGIIDHIDRNAAWSNKNILFYKNEDVNLDGVIDASDRMIIWNNRNLLEQLP